MIKKILKLLLKFLIGIILLIVVAYYSFLGWEYITGGKYVDYLKVNSETISIDDSFTYNIATEDIKNSEIILVGESHGFKEPIKFDFHFFKYLYNNFGVRTYLAELDFAQATMLNEFLISGDEDLLQAILKNWVVVQGRNNKDYFQKYIYFHEFYEQLPDNEKFQFIGIDKIQDWKLTMMLVNQLSKVDTTLIPIKYDRKKIQVEIKDRIKKLINIEDQDKQAFYILKHLQKNILYWNEETNREKVMFLNFKHLYSNYDLSNQKVYGYFGLYHVFQYRINGNHPFASQIRESDLGLEDKILSMNFLFVDSKMVTKSKALPEFMRDNGKYTKMTISADNLLFLYIYGICDFKRMTKPNHKSLVKMNGLNNPYSGSSRLNKTYQILPVTDIFKMTDKGKPYIQYTIFVRNSDWAEPMLDN